MSYWDKKDLLKNKAINHTKLMEEQYTNEIAKCILNTVVYNSCSYHLENKYTHSLVIQSDTVSAIFLPNCKDKKVCVLNFASYKNPGGKFLNGSSAQEESLCHESFLYNVLKEQYEYYNWN